MPKKKDEPEIGRRLSYKFRIYPNEEQKRILRQQISGATFVYNHFLHERIEAYERTQKELRRPVVVLDDNGEPKLDNNGREVYARDDKNKVIYHNVINENYDPTAKPMSYYDTSGILKTFKLSVKDKDTGRLWLYDVDAQALTYALRNLDKAYQNFFKGIKSGRKVGYPKYKNRKNPMNSYTTGSIHLCGHDADGNALQETKGIPSPLPADHPYANVTWTHIKLNKVGLVPCKVHRIPEGQFVSVTVSVNAADQWFWSVNVKEANDITPTPVVANSKVGITFGAARWVNDTDGAIYDLPDSIARLEKRKKHIQRELARKVEGSANWKKQKQKLARIEVKIANCRANATHNLTHEYVNTYDTICSREMNSKEMAQHKSGATEKLPRKVKKQLNHMVANGNFFEFNRQLAYKAEWNKRAFMLVPHDSPTAQVCHDCGYKETLLINDLRPTWVCPQCGTKHDRKFNGADNVLDAGIDLLTEQELAYVTQEREKTRKANIKKRAAASKKKKASAKKTN